MIDVLLLKQLHVFLAFSSVLFFSIRFICKEMEIPFIHWRVMKVAPHIIDTLLLASGLTLAWTYRLSPLDAKWFLLKLTLIFFYITFGFMAMKSKAFHYRVIGASFAGAFVISAIYLAQYKPF
ncbi:SirB2 family protein [Nitrincola nitratireducens]|nr:SirB2 family protein [Nitrincola nitratireducens]